jgi:hypothetical protein
MMMMMMYFLLEQRGNFLHFSAANKDDSFCQASTQVLASTQPPNQWVQNSKQPHIQLVPEVYNVHSVSTYGTQPSFQLVSETTQSQIHGYLRLLSLKSTNI